MGGKRAQAGCRCAAGPGWSAPVLHAARSRACGAGAAPVLVVESFTRTRPAFLRAPKALRRPHCCSVQYSRAAHAGRRAEHRRKTAHMSARKLRTCAGGSAVLSYLFPVR